MIAKVTNNALDKNQCPLHCLINISEQQGLKFQLPFTQLPMQDHWEF
jgi:hypothetical protein